MKHKFEDIIINVTQKKKPTDEDRQNYIGLEHLESGNLFVEKYGSERTPDGEKIIMKKGDVLFGKRRAYQKKVAISPCDGIFSAHGMVLRPKEDVICKEFLPFFISSDKFLDEAIRISVGGLSPTINWKDIKTLEFDLPPLDEQKYLAEKLWAAYEVKQSYLKMIAATDEMVKSQFIEMFGVESNGSCKNKIADYFELKAGKSMKSELISNEGSFPCYGGNGIRGYVESYTNEGAYCIIGRQGALCGNIQIASGKFYATEHAVVVNPKQKVDTLWLFYKLAQMNLNKYARGVAQPGLAVSQLEKLSFELPSVELQEQFAAIAQQADKSKFELRKSIDAIDKVIKSLINN